MRILIAEDDEALARFIRQGLECEQFKVDVFADGETPRDAAMQSEYDVVVLDLNLPKLDGVSVETIESPKAESTRISSEPESKQWKLVSNASIEGPMTTFSSHSRQIK